MHTYQFIPRFLVCGIVSLIGLVPSTTNGDLVQGDLLGVFAGNDSESSILTELGLDVSFLAKVDTPNVSSFGLMISNFTLDGDDEPISGEWAYAGPELVDLFIVKAGPSYAVYHHTDLNSNNMRNMGIWNNTDIPGNAAVSHVTAYSFNAVPEPSGFLFVSIAILGLVGNRRVRNRRL